MTFVYAKAFVLWIFLFPFLCMVNALKALVDFSLWIFDLPTNVWQMCVLLSSNKHQRNGVRKDGGNV